MKHPNRKYVLILLAVAMVIICFLSFGGVSAAALTPDYTLDPIYYFYDCYPVPKELELRGGLSLDSAYFDGQNVTEEEFYDLIDDQYFLLFEFGSVVIIDIKTFKPDLDKLVTLFQNARNRDCTTILVATYTQAEIAASSLNNYLDLYFQSDLRQLEEFVDNSLSNLSFLNGGFAGTCFLIDGNMVQHPNPSSLGMDAMIGSSPFLRLLLLELASQLNLLSLPTSNDDITVETYTAIVAELYYDYSITFLVHKMNNTYRRIYQWGYVQIPTVTQLQTQMAPSGTHICAFGFWGLTDSFYNFLYTEQQCSGPNNLPVYVFEIESVEYGTSGLVVHTDSNMASPSGDAYNERQRFYMALLDLREMLQ